MVLDSLFEASRDELFQQAALVRLDAVKRIETDSFVARSVLQKAIRRGERHLALRAAATLLAIDPEALWRRLLVIALEDLGIHQWWLLAKISFAERGKLARARVASDWQIASSLVAQACDGTRCQAANEMHTLARFDSFYDDIHRGLARLPVRDALDLAGDTSAGLVERYVAALHCLGQNNPSTRSPKPRVPVDELFTRLAKGTSPGIGELYAWTFKRARLPLSCASLLLHAVNGTPALDSPVYVTDDPLPAEERVGEVPSFALDQYTRAGRAAIKLYVHTSERWKGFAAPLRLAPKQEFAAAAELFFRIESAAATKRRSWDIARVIRQQAMHLGCYLPVPTVADAMQLTFAEVPLLNECRLRLSREAQCN